MRVVLALLCIFLSASLPARAESIPELSPLDAFLAQTLKVCGDSPAAHKFTDALRVELSATSFTPSAPTEMHTLRCDVNGGTLSLWLTNHELTLDVSDVPPTARVRTLAVAVAETLRLPTTEPHVDDAPPPSASNTDARPPQSVDKEHTTTQTRVPGSTSQVDGSRPKPRRVQPGWHVPVTIRALLLGPAHTVSLGATLGAAFPVTPAVWLGAHVGYLTTRYSSAFGNAQLHAVSLEGTFDLTVLRPSTHSSIDVGANARLYRAVVVVDSAWGLDEPDLDAWFALWSLHARLATVVSDSVHVFTRVAALKDIAGQRFSAGGKQAMSFYGLGFELALGAAYAF